MKKLILTFIVALMAITATAQMPGGGQQQRRPAFPFFFGNRVDTVKIWPNGAPNAFETKPGDQFTEAFMELYPARNPNGYCVIMCPGGGYSTLSLSHEGRDIHTWFNARGYTFCLLQYRLPRQHHDVPLSDVQEAIRIMRSRTDLGIKYVGVMGTSAGGHLAATAATHFKDQATRPDFQVLLYPVITLQEGITHMSSRQFLLGDDPTQEMIDLYSADKQVTKDTPPALIFLSSDDFLVPPANSIMYYQALLANHVSASMHIYPSGGHGWGWGDNFVYKTEWSLELERWLNTVIRK